MKSGLVLALLHLHVLVLQLKVIPQVAYTKVCHLRVVGAHERFKVPRQGVRGCVSSPPSSPQSPSHYRQSPRHPQIPVWIVLVQVVRNRHVHLNLDLAYSLHHRLEYRFLLVCVFFV